MVHSFTNPFCAATGLWALLKIPRPRLHRTKPYGNKAIAFPFERQDRTGCP